jgi:hypothetical protein
MQSIYIVALSLVNIECNCKVVSPARTVVDLQLAFVIRYSYHNAAVSSRPIALLPGNQLHPVHHIIRLVHVHATPSTNTHQYTLITLFNQ